MGILKQAVKRNLERFPKDFMFQLSKEEFENWKSQIVISNPAAKMGLRKRPYAFTELGVAMLSSILKSDRAVRVNMEIMRAFVRLRDMLSAHKESAKKLEALESKAAQRKCMGIEPTGRLVHRRPSDFEDRGHHQVCRHFQESQI